MMDEQQSRFLVDDDILVPDCSEDGVYSLLDSITHRINKDEARLVLIDLSGRLDCYRGNDYLLGDPIRDYNEACDFFSAIREEVQRRLIMLGGEGLRRLDVYNQLHPNNSLPFIVVFIGEVSELHLKKNSDFRTALINDDAAGVYFIICTNKTIKNLNFGADLNMFSVKDYESALALFEV